MGKLNLQNLKKDLEDKQKPTIGDFEANIGEILAKALEGKKINVEEAYQLINLDFKHLPVLMATANLLKFKGKKDKVSFSKKVFIPLTNLCRNACKYCGFRLEPSNKKAGFLTPKQVLEIAEKGKKMGCNEALFTLGEKPEEKYGEAKIQLKRLGYNTTIEYLYDMCKTVFEKTGLLPHSNPGVLTIEDLRDLREVNLSLGLMLENVSSRLCEKGGPHEFSPGKNPKIRLETIENAGKLNIAFTTGILLGIGETPEEIIDSFNVLREIHEKYQHLQEIIIQPFMAKKGTPMENHPEPSWFTLLKTVAVVRIFFGSNMNIQVPPNLTKPIIDLLPYAGINDWGGVSPITPDHINPEKPWPKLYELKEITQNCGFVLKQRLPIYPEYVKEKLWFIPEKFKDTVFERVDSEGYVKNGDI